MGDDDAARRQHVLDHAQAEWKSKIEPDRVSNHFGGKAVVAIQRITIVLGHAAYSHSFF